uniref:Uncharacterized protein n=1 Tax=Aegilops tauschii subsp. strangulata TaxID=200361 RepID=A0A452ZJX5_AEGTS
MGKGRKSAMVPEVGEPPRSPFKQGLGFNSWWLTACRPGGVLRLEAAKRPTRTTPWTWRGGPFREESCRGHVISLETVGGMKRIGGHDKPSRAKKLVKFNWFRKI